MAELLLTLCGSKTRASLLRLLFSEAAPRTVSELARLSGVTPKAMNQEVRRLQAEGLARVTALGSSHLVAPNDEHPAAPALREVVRQDRAAPPPDGRLREALVAYGAPLAEVEPHAHSGLEETVAAAASVARADATVLRVLPVVLQKNASAFDWANLSEMARRYNARAEVGMLLELTGRLCVLPELVARAASFRDRRRTARHFLPEPKNDYERRLARQRTPAVARKWGFFMNMSEDSFRAVLEKHGA
jgi:hypothetical protein